MEYEACSVCLESPNDSNAFTTPCNHVFHRACLNQWFNTRQEANLPQSCPLCRRELAIVLNEMSDGDRDTYLDYADTLGMEIAYNRQKILIASELIESLVSGPVRRLTGMDITGSTALIEQGIDQSLAEGNDLFAVEPNASGTNSLIAILSIVAISIFGAIFANESSEL